MNETEPVAILPTESVGTAIITRFNALKLEQGAARQHRPSAETPRRQAAQ